MVTGGDVEVDGVGRLGGADVDGVGAMGDGLLGFVFVGVDGVRAVGLFCCCCSCCLHFARLFLNHTCNN